MSYQFIKLFEESSLEDIDNTGGKNASLGEMIKNLKHINFPKGFIITTKGYDLFTRPFKDDLVEMMKNHEDEMKKKSFSAVSRKIKQLIRAQILPQQLFLEIKDAYLSFCRELQREDLEVAVRSSATAEDLPNASFAGQHESYLNVSGLEAIVDACLNCYASLFSERALHYRHLLKMDHLKVKISIGIQQMIRSDIGSSGVLFTLDTESGSKNIILINSSWGLGENIVKGRVDADEFIILKESIGKYPYPILKKRKGEKKSKIIYHPGGKIKEITTPFHEQKSYSLTNSEIIQLSKWGLDIETYFSNKNADQETSPMDVEWAKDGISNKLYIVQARPETTHKKDSIFIQKKLLKRSKVLAKGIAVGTSIGSGKIKKLKSLKELSTFHDGHVLVAEMTDPDWENVMSKSSAIITSKGSRTCHAAIISREHNVPCVVGVKDAFDLFEDGDEVTVSCAEGEEAIIYDGILPFEEEEISVKKNTTSDPKFMINLSHPDKALRSSMLPVSGVGLARMEFIIAEVIKIHPLALIYPEKILHKNIQDQINKITKGYSDPRNFFIHQLAQGISTIAGAFYPREVIVRFSDFKTNEYAHLIGGEYFELHENNPMIGLRGASRYVSSFFQKAFEMECEAMNFCINNVGLDNIILMIPFCRTLSEAHAVKDKLSSLGLDQTKKSTPIKIYMMCEVPSNVILIEKFADIFDGFSIGSNDLTQLTLAIDRDSSQLSYLFDERNEAVKEMIKIAIKGSHQRGRPIGICGEAPSNYPEFLDFLKSLHIDSISLSSDSVISTIKHIHKSSV